MAKHCRIVCDTPAGIRECELALSDEADVQAAIAAARALIGEDAIDWQSAVTGIFGRVCERSHVPADGDRIELYRALPSDPRHARRERAGRGAGARRRRG
jgi:putative ubiquitin-RnfH superfamily antitoxin RatB of RatAB toxin-antitoxin module